MSSRQSVTKKSEEDFLAAQREQLSTRTRTELQNELETRGIKLKEKFLLETPRMIFLFPKLSPVHWRLQQNCDKAFSRNHACK